MDGESLLLRQIPSQIDISSSNTVAEFFQKLCVKPCAELRSEIEEVEHDCQHWIDKDDVSALHYLCLHLWLSNNLPNQDEFPRPPPQLTVTVLDDCFYFFHDAASRRLVIPCLPPSILPKLERALGKQGFARHCVEAAGLTKAEVTAVTQAMWQRRKQLWFRDFMSAWLLVDAQVTRLDEKQSRSEILSPTQNRIVSPSGHGLPSPSENGLLSPSDSTCTLVSEISMSLNGTPSSKSKNSSTNLLSGWRKIQTMLRESTQYSREVKVKRVYLRARLHPKPSFAKLLLVILWMLSLYAAGSWFVANLELRSQAGENLMPTYIPLLPLLFFGGTMSTWAMVGVLSPRPLWRPLHRTPVIPKPDSPVKPTDAAQVYSFLLTQVHRGSQSRFLCFLLLRMIIGFLFALPWVIYYSEIAPIVSVHPDISCPTQPRPSSLRFCKMFDVQSWSGSPVTGTDCDFYDRAHVFGCCTNSTCTWGQFRAELPFSCKTPLLEGSRLATDFTSHGDIPDQSLFNRISCPLDCPINSGFCSIMSRLGMNSTTTILRRSPGANGALVVDGLLDDPVPSTNHPTQLILHSQAECSHECNQDSDCSLWTFRPTPDRSGNCTLLRSVSNIRVNDNTENPAGSLEIGLPGSSIFVNNSKPIAIMYTPPKHATHEFVGPRLLADSRGSAVQLVEALMLIAFLLTPIFTVAGHEPGVAVGKEFEKWGEQLVPLDHITNIAAWLKLRAKIAGVINMSKHTQVVLGVSLMGAFLTCLVMVLAFSQGWDQELHATAPVLGIFLPSLMLTCWDLYEKSSLLRRLSRLLSATKLQLQLDRLPRVVSAYNENKTEENAEEQERLRDVVAALDSALAETQEDKIGVMVFGVKLSIATIRVLALAIVTWFISFVLTAIKSHVGELTNFLFERRYTSL